MNIFSGILINIALHRERGFILLYKNFFDICYDPKVVVALRVRFTIRQRYKIFVNSSEVS